MICQKRCSEVKESNIGKNITLCGCLSACYLTALANERLGQPFAPEPVLAAAVPEVLRRLEPLEDLRLAAEGEPGRLLLDLARRRLGELAPVREGAAVRPEVVTALLLR